MKTVKILVSGRVHGVFFRVYTREYAQKLSDLTGYVKNRRDGRVEIFAEGPEESLLKLARWAKEEGSPASQITGTEEIWGNTISKREYQDFKITF
ncbi:acylphosphatase [Candidatus Hodarchaeum mangrovi]